MTTLREALSGIVWILGSLLVVALIVVGLEAVMPPRDQRQSPTEVNFRAACVAVKGAAVWNGRHWECIK